jgi:AraC-like DNA-binding protein
MKDWVGRIKELSRVGFYMAPDNAKVTPFKIPEDMELVEVLTGGEVLFEVDGELKTFGKGTIFWHQAGEETIWRTTPEAPYRCVVFHFLVNDLNRPVPRVSSWSSNMDADFDRFTSESIKLFHEQKLDVDVLGLYIYSTLLRHAMANEDSFSRRSYPKPLDQSIDYIQHNIGKNISITALAKQSRVSKPHLFKLFQTHLGITPHQYILSLQLARARTLLAGSMLSIKEIASECGFESLEVFYRRFRRENHIPPGEYRRKYQMYQFLRNS